MNDVLRNHGPEEVPDGHAPELVSVVIPTFKRPRGLANALNSVLGQSYGNLEVIVVSDGTDLETKAFMSTVESANVRFVELATRRGACAARNRGVQESKGAWIALLDDDDEWLPEKIEEQLSVAHNAINCVPVVACRVHVNRGVREDIWPTRKPATTEPISEYVFCRSGTAQGEGLIITSMLLAPRKLFLQVPFRMGVRRHQDTDWVLRATSEPGVKLLWAWKPLALFNLDPNVGSISRSTDPEPSLSWVRRNRSVTPLAYCFFLATQVGPRLELMKDLRTAMWVARELLSKRRIGRRPFALFVLFLLTTPRLRASSLAALNTLKRLSARLHPLCLTRGTPLSSLKRVRNQPNFAQVPGLDRNGMAAKISATTHSSES
jgi:glycosyltransferase involved in cell wall biosynthesis